MSDFFNEPFSDTTRIKLEIFRRYTREWLSVFLTKWASLPGQPNRVNLLDFFAGPGRDSEGNPGSPLILYRELQNYCSERSDLKNPHLSINLVLNDLNPDNIRRLRENLKQEACGRGCCNQIFTALPFEEALTEHKPLLSDHASASLVILDQFGVKHVSPGTMRDLLNCSKTDVVLFIASAFAHRFADTLGPQIGVDPSILKNSSHSSVHRAIGESFREALAPDEYHITYFSLEKGSNIYGVIFGSGHLKGLERFLKVCWDLDPNTGEANHNIDNEIGYKGDTLFEEFNQPKKATEFQRRLEAYVQETSPTNGMLYRFCLENGFLATSKYVTDKLTELTRDGQIEIVSLDSKPVRASCWYLTWDNYWKRLRQVRYLWKG